MTTDTTLADLLADPLSPDWTIDRLAEDVLLAIADHPMQDGQELVLDRAMTSDHQSCRLIRPLLACLATKSAAEMDASVNVHGGQFRIQRPGPGGPVWIVGEFVNTPDAARVVFRRLTSALIPKLSQGLSPPVDGPAETSPDGRSSRAAS